MIQHLVASALVTVALAVTGQGTVGDSVEQAGDAAATITKPASAENRVGEAVSRVGDTLLGR